MNFFTSLRKSASYEVQVMSRYVARDVQSVTGKNLRLIEETVNLDPWTTSSSKLRNALIIEETVTVPAMDRWEYLISALFCLREEKPRTKP